MQRGRDDEFIQEDRDYSRNPTVPRLCELVAKLIHEWEQINQQFMAHSGNLGSTSSSSALGKHPRTQKPVDPINKHAKATDSDDNLPCQGCGRFGHRRESCDLRSHPDFNLYGDWAGVPRKSLLERIYGPHH